MSSRLSVRLVAFAVGAVIPLSMLPAALLALRQLLPQESVVAALLLAGTLTCTAVGALIAIKQPANRIGWLMLGIGVIAAFAQFAKVYSVATLIVAPPSLPFGIWAAWAFTWLIWLVLTGLPMILLLFPSGRPPSPRWRIVGAVVLGAGGLLCVLTMLTPGPIRLSPGSSAMGTNPLGGLVAPGLVVALYRPVDYLYLLAVVPCALAPISRWRNADGDERQQLKVLAYVAAWVAAGILAMATGPIWPPVLHEHQLGGWLSVLTLVGFLVGLPLGVAVAILRYRLYGIDTVINKTIVFGALALFVSASYVLIVVGIGALVGAAAQANLLLSVLATAAVAIAFQPVRAKAQALADRLVFGRRANPHAVLSQISQMVAASTSTDQVLGRLLELLGAATGAAAAAIYVGAGGPRQLVACWPAGKGDVRGPALPITHQGERLGDLVVGRAEPPTPAEARLLADVASQAGLLLSNLRLNADLEARVDELAESRRRIVAAQDAERRRLERDIHDGVQQQVVALMAKLRLARNQAGRHSELATITLDEVQADAGRLLDDLRELASGIHPVLLSDGGIVAALRARTDRLPIKVVINASSDVRGLRYPEAVEAAGYFIACEALANVLKHARATRATVFVEAEDHILRIVVKDDGRGFDLRTVKPSGLRGLEDRAEALGGRLHITTSPGAGTTVSATLPADG